MFLKFWFYNLIMINERLLPRTVVSKIIEKLESGKNTPTRVGKEIGYDSKTIAKYMEMLEYNKYGWQRL